MAVEIGCIIKLIKYGVNLQDECLSNLGYVVYELNRNPMYGHDWWYINVVLSSSPAWLLNWMFHGIRKTTASRMVGTLYSKHKAHAHGNLKIFSIKRDVGSAFPDKDGLTFCQFWVVPATWKVQKVLAFSKCSESWTALGGSVFQCSVNEHATNITLLSACVIIVSWEMHGGWRHSLTWCGWHVVKFGACCFTAYTH